MAPVRKVTTFRVDEDVQQAMDVLKERDGIPYSEQIRRAVRLWLEDKGVLDKAERKRAATRKRS